MFLYVTEKNVYFAAFGCDTHMLRMSMKSFVNHIVQIYILTNLGGHHFSIRHRKRLLKCSSMPVDLSVFTCISVSFCSLYFEIMLLDIQN